MDHHNRSHDLYYSFFIKASSNCFQSFTSTTPQFSDCFRKLSTCGRRAFVCFLQFRCFQLCFAGFAVMCFVVTFDFLSLTSSTPPPFTCSVFEPVFLPYSLSASLFSVWCWFVCVCSSCVTFFSSFCPLPLSGLLLVLYSVFFLFFSFFLGFSFI